MFKGFILCVHIQNRRLSSYHFPKWIEWHLDWYWTRVWFILNRFSCLTYFFFFFRKQIWRRRSFVLLWYWNWMWVCVCVFVKDEIFPSNLFHTMEIKEVILYVIPYTPTTYTQKESRVKWEEAEVKSERNAFKYFIIVIC